MSDEYAINHDAPMPVYLQLAAALRKQIEGGDLAPGARLPSETELEAATGLARGTVKKAIELLRQEGLVVTWRGRGSFVADQAAGADE